MRENKEWERISRRKIQKKKRVPRAPVASALCRRFIKLNAINGCVNGRNGRKKSLDSEENVISNVTTG